MTDETKNNWRERWLNSINELSSIGLQQISWTNISLNNPHWTFTEFLSCYFDDLVLSDNYNDEIEQGFVTSDEYKIIENWHKSLSEYRSPNNNDFDNYAILNDVKWKEIVEQGKLSKLNLVKILNSTEQQILLNNINIA